MKEFCRSCGDRDSAVCAIPSAGVWLGRRAAWACLEVVEMLGHAYDANTPTSHVVIAAREVLVQEELGIEACIRAHTGEILSP